MQVATTTCQYDDALCLQKDGTLMRPCNNDSITMAFATSTCVTTTMTIADATSSATKYVAQFTAGDVAVSLFLFFAIVLSVARYFFEL